MLLDQSPVYYVYVLFDWRGVPRWIGKGKKDRIDGHERQSDRSNWMKNEFIEQTWNVLGEVPKLKIRVNLTEAEAFESEIAFIAAIGRHPKGPLVNMTDGGDGVKGLSKEKRVRAALMRSARLGPERRSAIARYRESVMSPEDRRARARRGVLGMTKEALIERARKAAEALTPQQKRERAVKAASGRSVEANIIAGLKSAATLGPALLRQRALLGAAKMPDGWHDATMKKARDALDMSPEAKRERARRAQASRTPEERSEIARKTWASRRAKIKEIGLDL